MTFTPVNHPVLGQPSLGFTGTRRGMSEPQKKAVRILMERFGPNILYHGDAKGADADADAIAKELGIPRVAIPGVTASGAYKDRAYCDSEVVLDNGLTFITRNHMIVDLSDVMIATPAEMSMIRRSGTWATVRYAIKSNTQIWVVLRDGSQFTVDELEDVSNAVRRGEGDDMVRNGV